MTDVIITSVVDPQATVADSLSDGAEADDSSHAQLPEDATPKDATTEGRTATPKILDIYRS